MSVPNCTVEEFAAQLRGDGAYTSNAHRAQSIRHSELVAAAAFDYGRVYGGVCMDRDEHQEKCARFIAKQLDDEITVPSIAFGMPPFLIAVLFGLAVKAIVELIWHASGLMAEHLGEEA